MGDEAPRSVRRAAAGLRHVSVRCVNLGVGRENLTDKHWIYYPEDTVFHRIFVQGNASPHCNPAGRVRADLRDHLRPATSRCRATATALIERCIADCIKVGIINADDPILARNQVDMPYAYVVYDHARPTNVAVIRDWLAGTGHRAGRAVQRVGVLQLRPRLPRRQEGGGARQCERCGRVRAQPSRCASPRRL